jgi:hypothetical protein
MRQRSSNLARATRRGIRENSTVERRSRERTIHHLYRLVTLGILSESGKTRKVRWQTGCSIRSFADFLATTYNSLP